MLLLLLQWAAEQAEIYEIAYGSDHAVADSDSDYERSSKRRKQSKKGRRVPKQVAAVVEWMQGGFGDARSKSG